MKFNHRKIVLLSFALLLLIGAFSLSPLKPLPQATSENTQSISGKVIKVEETGEKDITFILESDKAGFYINRGLEQGLTTEKMQELEGKEIRILYIEGSRHIAQITLPDTTVIYSEMTK